MKPSLRQQFERLALRLAELDATLGDPNAVSDMKRFRELTREHAEVSSLVERFRHFEQRERDLAAAQEMATQASDCRATPTTSATRSSKSAPVPAATNRRCSPPTWRACTCAIASATAGAAS
jgi:protein subunit release factor A